MSNMRTKLIVAAIVLVGAVGYLSWGAIKSGWVYFFEVDKFLADAQYHAQRVRLVGKVATEGFEVSAGTLKASFNLQGHTNALAVVYHGSVPDMFGAGKEVVVEGKLNASGTFEADVLMTKCASKYEPKSPHAGNGPQRPS